jgi:hypothetical protein
VVARSAAAAADRTAIQGSQLLAAVAGQKVMWVPRGRLLVSETAPSAGAAWTDSGQRRDRRQLKQRAEE